MKIRTLIVGSLIAVALLGVTSTASAGDFYASDSAGITTAINAADGAAGADTVHIAAGTYAITSATFPSLSAGAQLDIVGAGKGETIFTGDASSSGLIGVHLPSSDSELRGFTLTANAPSNFLSAIWMTKGAVRDFAVNLTGFNASGVTGVIMQSGTEITDGSINTVGTKTAISAYDGSVTARRMTLAGGSGAFGISAGGTVNATFSRIRTSGFSTGIIQQNGSVALSDSLIDIGSTASGVGLYTRDQNTGSGSNVNFTGQRLTIVGNGTNQLGYLTGTGSLSDINDSVTWGLYDSILYLTGATSTSMLCDGPNSVGSPGKIASNVSVPSGGCNSTPNVVSLASSPFVNAASQDYRPLWYSPLIDIGSLVPGAGFPSDLADATRTVDGDNNGSAIVDLGAFEYQATPPSGAIAAPATAQTGAPVNFNHTMVELDPTNSIDGVLWNFGDGSTSTEDAPSHVFAAPGTYTVSLAATNQAGSVGTATAVVTVQPLPALPAAPVALNPAAKITAKAKKSFTIAKSGFAAPKKKQPFFMVTFTDSASAKFTLKSIGKNKKLKSVKGSQTLNVKTGATRFAFNGKFGGKKLKAGKYRVSITPLSSAGVAGKSVTTDIKLK